MSPTSLSQESSLDLIDDDAATSLLCLEEDRRSSCDGEPNKQGEKRKIEDSSSSPPPKPSTKRPREKKLKCHYPDCSATFSRPDRLQTHIDGNHVHILRYQCPTCGESFASQGYLSKHIGRVHNKQTRKKKTTTPKSNSISEEDSEIEASSFSSALPTDELGVIRRGSACPSCARVFRRKYQLRLHRAELHGEPLPHRCPHCPASFPLLYKLRRHCGSVHQPRLYRCAFATTSSTNCPFTTDKFSLLRKHHATGHPEIRLRCAACGKTYRRADSLRIHEETAHKTLNDRVPVFACDRPGCSKTYSRESCLRTHLRNSHDAPRFGPCEKCGGRFRHSKSFRQHVARCKKKGMMPGEENAQSKGEPSEKVKKVKVKVKKETKGPKEAKKVEKKKKKPVDEEQRKAVAAYRRRLQRLPPVVFEEEEEENENGDGEGGDVEVTDEVDLVVKVVVDHQTLPADDESDGGGGCGDNDLTAA